MTIKPKPGDKIIVTNKLLEHIYGQKCVVVKSPWRPQDVDNISECIFVRGECNALFWLQHGSYRTTNKEDPRPDQFCIDCKGTGEIELLTSKVKCNCQADSS